MADKYHYVSDEYMSVHNCYDAIERALALRAMFDDFSWQLANESGVVTQYPPLQAGVWNLTTQETNINYDFDGTNDTDANDDTQNLEDAG